MPRPSHFKNPEIRAELVRRIEEGASVRQALLGVGSTQTATKVVAQFKSHGWPGWEIVEAAIRRGPNRRRGRGGKPLRLCVDCQSPVGPESRRCRVCSPIHRRTKIQPPRRADALTPADAERGAKAAAAQEELRVLLRGTPRMTPEQRVCPRPHCGGMVCWDPDRIQAVCQSCGRSAGLYPVIPPELAERLNGLKSASIPRDTCIVL